MYNRSSGPTLINVVFSGNHAGGNGGGLLNNIGSPTLDNCILWGNTADGSGNQVYQLKAITTFSYSLVEGGCPAGSTCDHLLTADPQFVDADGTDDIVGTRDDDLRLSISSPAIDAGDNSAIPAGVITDLDGNPRFWDMPDVPDTGGGRSPIVDMGTYETAMRCVYLPLVVKD